ncbi:transporter [Streptomyces eurocidicus]|uniref:Transporter n=1 Tax=Streptomyces eurocidicus TaxID=66423 RepID=A0A2N8NM55_STREU|nr:MFS transporter [Streptomyces eurocidicus]MBB5118331.1 CP family cyanate transporter-like MFS transporter [Streptomyces eurocidicus]PNE29854.1 transporter [Streptomyces eurocidicus]
MAHMDEELTAPRPTAHPPDGVTHPGPEGTGDRLSGGARGGLLVLALVIAALNLRPAVTSLGPLLKEVRAGLGMSGAVAGLLTSVPALCFAAFGLAAPRLSRRWGPAGVVCAGMAVTAAGLALRPFLGGVPGFLALSALALAGIAVGNVLMPVVVKGWFPDRIGPMTGLYTMAVAAGTSLAAATTVPLTGALGGGWRLGLLVWAALAAVAVAPWAVLTVRERRSRAAAATAGDAPRTRITRSPTAWALASFFGLQSTSAYIAMGWLPAIFRDAGVPATTAGVLLAATMLMGVPLSFLLPSLAARLARQGVLAAALACCGLAGYAGLWLDPAGGAWAWVVLLGLSNCAFSLALTMIGMRARTGDGVVRLSAFAQGTGYLLAVPGPLLVGWLNETTGGWDVPIAFMAALMVPQAVAGVLAGRDRVVEDEI